MKNNKKYKGDKEGDNKLFIHKKKLKIKNLLESRQISIYEKSNQMEFGAMQTSCLLHKWPMSKEKGKKNSKSNLTLT